MLEVHSDTDGVFSLSNDVTYRGALWGSENILVYEEKFKQNVNCEINHSVLYVQWHMMFRLTPYFLTRYTTKKIMWFYPIKTWL